MGTRNEIRKNTSSVNLKKLYPCCIGGNTAALLEDYDGPLDYIERQPANFKSGMDALLNNLSNGLEKANKESSLNNSIKNKIIELIDWVNQNKFNRKNLNNKLLPYAKGTLNLKDVLEDEVFLCG